MIVEFDKSFERSIDKIRDRKLLERIKSVIYKAEKASSLEEIPNVKKLTGFPSYYRIKLGDYRLGLEKINSKTIRLIIIENRKDIYKRFP